MITDKHHALLVLSSGQSRAENLYVAVYTLLNAGYPTLPCHTPPSRTEAHRTTPRPTLPCYISASGS